MIEKKWNATKLNDYGVRMKHRNFDEFEVSCPSERTRTRSKFRIRVCSQGWLYVYRPGKGGTFALSYDYLIGNIKARGHGYMFIYNKLKNGRYQGSGDHYVAMIASAIDNARLLGIQLIDAD